MNLQYSIRKFSEDATVKRPKELGSFSRNLDNQYLVDDSHLNYYYFPDNDLNAPDGIDLTGGFKNFQQNPKLDYGDFAGLLKCLQKYEQENNKKVSAKIISWRGIMRALMLLPYENRDSLVLNIVVFDGQLFIQSDAEYQKVKFEKEKSEITDAHKMMIYAGYKFETLTTLPKPWTNCTRKEIEKRNKLPVNNIEQYSIMVKTTIGSTPLLIGAEVDCVWDFKPSDGSDPLQHYVELKTTGVLSEPKQIFNFEHKLLKTWAQCFLAGIPRVIYGFRDGDMKLRSIEEYQTNDIPLLIKNNPISIERHRQNPNYRVVNKSMQSIKYLSGLLSWLETSIPLDDESKTYRLSFDNSVNPMFLNLTENTEDITKRLLSPYKDETGGMLTNEFRDWRYSLKHSN